ncbi:MAG: hypothetical protein KGL59_10505 [Acidobacteriota bacterium]|nr:hypothetical protein [Acidobacteriota bacterium]
MRKFRHLPVSPALMALGCAFVLLAVAASAQDVPKQNLRLIQEIPIRLPSSATPLAGAPQCDNNGALYFRVSQDGSSSPQKTPIIAVSSTGFPDRMFSLSSVPGYDLSTTASVIDFVVGDTGDVYVLASKAAINGPDPDLDLIRFSSGTRYLSTLRLSHFYLPRRFAVLTGGSYFLLALDRDFSVPGPIRQFLESSFVYPVGLFFGSKGKLVREIALPDTTKPTLTATAASLDHSAQPAGSDPAFVATSYDGTIYVVRHKPDLAVYVITDSGATVDSLNVTAPFPKAEIVGIAPAGPRKLAIEFAHPSAAPSFDDGNAVFSIIDAESGERLVDYQATPETAGSLGCPTPVGFELLAHQPNGNLAIRFVSAPKPADGTNSSTSTEKSPVR